MSSNHDDPASCTASNRPPDGPAVGADGDRSDRARSVGRRTFVKGLGASAATVAGLSRSGAVQNASAVIPLIPLGPAAAGAGLGYLVNEGVDRFLGDERDYSGYTGADALTTEIRTGVTQMRSADERVMTSVQNNLQNSQNVALAKGKSVVLEVMNNEGSESEATTALQDAIDAYFSTIEENIITHGNAQVAQLHHMIDRLEQHSDANVGDVFEVGRSDANNTLSGSPGPINTTTEDYTLLNGSTVTRELLNVEKDGYSGSSTHHLTKESTSTNRTYRLSYVDSGGNNVEIPPNYHGILDTVASNRDSVNSQLSGFVTDVYSQYAPGDIPTEDLVDPITLATEMGQNTGLASQAAEAAILGIPTSASFSLWLELQDGDGDVTREVEAEMYTTATPTDSDGNAVGWEVGTTYDPANFDPPIYIAYEYIEPDSGEKSSDLVELDNPFTVIEATGSDGNEVTSFQNEERINQTADVSKLEEELQQLRDEQQRLQAKAQASGGGGFSFDSFSMLGLPGEAIALGGAAVVSYFALGD